MKKILPSSLFFIPCYLSPFLWCVLLFLTLFTASSFFLLSLTLCVSFARPPSLSLVLHLSLSQGVKRCSPVTGCEEFYYPPWRRRLFRWLVSLPICILCLCFVFLAMLICFELQVRSMVTARAHFIPPPL